MHEKPPWIDIPNKFASNNRCLTMWFLKVEKICPLKDDHVNFPLKSVANKKLQFDPITMNIKTNIKDIVDKFDPNGIIIKNLIEFYLGQVGPKKWVPNIV